jgi:16S rRNA (guanine(966)-N(2))-methyltransferase RsmD
VHGARVLDLYCGAGTLGIEALSRGAEAAVFVDRSRRTLACVTQNLEATGFVAKSTCVRRELPEQLDSDLGDGFRIVFSDPPYASDPVERLGELLATGLVTEDAVWVHEGAAKPARGYEMPNWRQHEPRRYGDTAIWLFDHAG